MRARRNTRESVKIVTDRYNWTFKRVDGDSRFSPPSIFSTPLAKRVCGIAYEISARRTYVRACAPRATDRRHSVYGPKRPPTATDGTVKNTVRIHLLGNGETIRFFRNVMALRASYRVDEIIGEQRRKKSASTVTIVTGNLFPDKRSNCRSAKFPT